MSVNRCGGAITLATALLLAVVAAGSVRAQGAVEAFYKGRQINLIVGYGPGGGYDLTARLLARHIGRF
jgi:tripartite-type tricarboxylate transporter receptor subunit TctC